MAHLIEADWRELWGADTQWDSVGSIYTKAEVVAFILDLAGYSSVKDLHRLRILEPSCGDGAFVTAVTQRLASSRLQHHFEWTDPVLEDAITATDIDEHSLEVARSSSTQVLIAAGCPEQRAYELCSKWFKHLDFLLEPWKDTFDFVVGNPPYVRLEDVPTPVMRRYRCLYSAVTDRADLYVAFFQRGLELLNDRGTLAFICANRFVKSQYGAALRRIIVKHHRVRYYVNLEHSQPFESVVSAYPAIFVVDRRAALDTLATTIESDLIGSMVELIEEASGRKPLNKFQRFADWYSDGSEWASTSTQRYREMKDLQDLFPALEQSAADTRIGIGVATGADQVFVLPCLDHGIEKDRQIPLVLARDVNNQSLEFSGHYLINPFAAENDGSLVNLRDYPGLAAHLERHARVLRQRHVAKKNLVSWYRTIDRIWPEWQFTSKLLIPDIRGEAAVGLDTGAFYPHHNLYWITSSWPLAVLKTFLRSTFVHRQVEAFSVQMRGGALRFQAQTLRKIRIPPLSCISDNALERLAAVSQSLNRQEIDDVVEAAIAKAIEVRRAN